jgi:hypothetical protein
MAGTAQILVNIYDGARQPLASGVEWMATLNDGQPLTARKSHDYRGLNGPSKLFEVPFFNMPVFDNYTVFASVDGCQDTAWFPVAVHPSAPVVVDLMALPKGGSAHFAGATWLQLNATRPGFADIVRRGAGTVAKAEVAYGEVLENRPKSLACFLNILTAMGQITLPSGKTPLDYYWNIAWPDGDPTAANWLTDLDGIFKQDRFFCYVDANILPDVQQAAKQGSFAPEGNPGAFHSDATESYKQTQFDFANVQLTFHGHDVATLTGADGAAIKCVKIEPDIDYYRDLGAHGLIEVIPNMITHGLTDPLTVYMLRWMAGQRAGLPPFNPLYTVETGAAAQAMIA